MVLNYPYLGTNSIKAIQLIGLTVVTAIGLTIEPVQTEAQPVGEMIISSS